MDLLIVSIVSNDSSDSNLIKVNIVEIVKKEEIDVKKPNPMVKIIIF